jgi:hypothetical protein
MTGMGVLGAALNNNIVYLLSMILYNEPLLRPGGCALEPVFEKAAVSTWPLALSIAGMTGVGMMGIPDYDSL